MAAQCIRCYETSTIYKNLYRTEQIIHDLLSTFLVVACKALLQIILLLAQITMTALWSTLDYNNRYPVGSEPVRKLESVRILVQKTVSTARSEINATIEVFLLFRHVSRQCSVVHTYSAFGTEFEKGPYYVRFI
jgi:hypothetical protein